MRPWPPLNLPELEFGKPVQWQEVMLYAVPLTPLPQVSGPSPLLKPGCYQHAPEWLGPEEANIYEGFPYPARAQEWLAGRFAGKTLLKAMHGLSVGDVQILPEPTEAPMVHYRGNRRPDVSLSLTHTDLCAVAAISHFPVGVDACDLEDGERIERIARRVFSEGKAEATGALETNERGALVWALKEAGLKVDIGGVFTPGARSIRVRSLDPVALDNPGLNAGAWRLPESLVAVAFRRGSPS